MSLSRLLTMVGTFVLLVAPSLAQSDSSASDTASPTFKSQSRLVLVDAVVTNKKGDYLRDLTAKDFKVFEDNEEQPIKSFSFEAGPDSPLKDLSQYTVLFFDNASMQTGDQMQARQAAVHFIDSNSGERRLMAVVNFSGSLQIAQNFTSDKALLKQAANGVKIPTVSSNDVGGFSLSSSELEFGAIDSLLALRSLATRLSSLPGRKTVVLLTAGFHLTPDLIFEATATIDACNKADVAIYPIDVRGLVAPAELRPPFPDFAPAAPALDGAYIVKAAFVPQRGAAPIGGGGSHTTPVSPGRGSTSPGTGSGGKTGSTRPAGSGRTIPATGNPPASLLPPFPATATDNQQLMYMLASGTGGFVIVNTNDLLGGMQKVGREADEYYVLGYEPPTPDDGECHVIKVKVEHNLEVRSRTGYCSVRPADLLSGRPAAKELEAKLAGSAVGNVAGTMQSPFFYYSPDHARVDFALDVPVKSTEFVKEKGRQVAVIQILGVLAKPNGSEAERFSDAVHLDFDKKELNGMEDQAIHYQKQFNAPAGTYTLKVVFQTGGANFGRLEAPLVIDPYDGKHLRVSSLAWTHQTMSGPARDAALISGLDPLTAMGVQFAPFATNRLPKTETSFLYVEIYEPLMTEKQPPIVAVALKVTDHDSHQVKRDTGLMKVDKYMRVGNPVIPVALPMSVQELGPGSYLAELRSVDSAGRSSTRTAPFSVE